MLFKIYNEIFYRYNGSSKEDGHSGNLIAFRSYEFTYAPWPFQHLVRPNKDDNIAVPCNNIEEFVQIDKVIGIHKDFASHTPQLYEIHL